MPYTSRGKCVYKKDTGKKVGCTKGSVKKYLAALHANVHDEKKKPISFKEYFAKVTAANGSQQYADTTVTAEGEYAQGQDNVAQPGGYDTIGFKDNGPTFTVEKSEKDKVIDSCIDFLEKLNKKGIPFDTEEMDKLLGQLQKMSNKLFSVGIEPVDIEATIKNPRMAYQYLIKGPSAPGGGGKGALQDLKDIKAGLLTDDESNPGGADVTADIENIDYNNFIIKPFLNDPNNGKDQPEGALENFMDKKGPGRPGDSRRHGIKKKPSLASLDKIVRSKTASPRKKQLAHWQANMRRGKAKKR
jgi:hypothetical protein